MSRTRCARRFARENGDVQTVPREEEVEPTSVDVVAARTRHRVEDDRQPAGLGTCRLFRFGMRSVRNVLAEAADVRVIRGGRQ